MLMIAVDRLDDKVAKFLTSSGDVSGDFGFKFNLDYVLMYGLKEFNKLSVALGKKIFVDLKMFNGIRTMKAIIDNIKADYINVHAAVGTKYLSELSDYTKNKGVKLLALTVLSHFDDKYCKEIFGIDVIEQAVEHFAHISCRAQCYGIILPGTCLPKVENVNIFKVATGIRPEWYKDNRHKQVVTPTVAIRNGADIIVCGSPITKSDNPIESLEKILKEMEEA